MEKEQDFIFGREKVQTVEHTEKENFHFSIVPHTFLRLGRPAPKFRQTCTITQKQLILEVLNVSFGFLVPKNLPAPIFNILASLEVIF